MRRKNIWIQKNITEEPAGDSDLFKAVKLLEENLFYVTHADTEQHKNAEPGKCLGYTGALVIRAYPKRFVAVKVRPSPTLVF